MDSTKPTGAQSGITKFIIVLTISLTVLLIFVPFTAPRTILLTKRLRNGPLSPKKLYKPQPRSTKVFSPRTQRELNYLAKPFLKDFVALTTASQMLFVNTATITYGYCPVPGNADVLHKQLVKRILPVANGKRHDLLEAWIRDDSFPKYVIVRNPITRILSAYRDKVEARRKSSTNQVEAFHDWVEEQFPTGWSFTAEELSRMNPLWMPQHIHCGMHKARVFRVFKYEQPKPFLRFITPIVGKDLLRGWRGRSFHEVIVDHVEDSERDVDHVFTDYFNDTSVFDKVKEFSKRDIDMFDYADDVREMRELIVEKMGIR